MPPFAGAAEWLNSEPLGPAELRGHVVLVNFWTLTCINWLRQEPYVRAWSQAYRDDGLVVIGVHTPEFSFEHEIDRIRPAIKEREIDYPVAVDNHYAIWSAFDNHYWPALYFIDAGGHHPRPPLRRRTLRAIRAHHPAAARRAARTRLRRRARRRGASRLEPPPDARDISRLRAQRALRASRRSPRSSPTPTRYQSGCRSTTGRSPATGRSGARTSSLTRPAAASPSGSTRATRISCYPPERERRSPSAYSSMARLRARQQASTSTRTETACSGTAACTSSYANTTRSTSRRLRSHSSNAVPRRTSFTFG